MTLVLANNLGPILTRCLFHDCQFSQSIERATGREVVGRVEIELKVENFRAEIHPATGLPCFLIESTMVEMPSSVGETSKRNGTLQGALLIKNRPSYYTSSQISQWLSCIRFPTSYNDAEISSGAFPPTLQNLEDLMRLHLIAFPFENTEMH